MEGLGGRRYWRADDERDLPLRRRHVTVGYEWPNRVSAAGLQIALFAVENARDRYAETRQDILGRQKLGFAHDREVVDGAVNGDHAHARAHDPDVPGPGFHEVVGVGLDLIELVVGCDDDDGEVGSSGKDVQADRPILDALVADYGGVERDHACGRLARQKARAGAKAFPQLVLSEVEFELVDDIGAYEPVLGPGRGAARLEVDDFGISHPSKVRAQIGRASCRERGEVAGVDVS